MEDHAYIGELLAGIVYLIAGAQSSSDHDVISRRLANG